jgi:hypothetical protein
MKYKDRLATQAELNDDGIGVGPYYNRSDFEKLMEAERLATQAELPDDFNLSDKPRDNPFEKLTEAERREHFAFALFLIHEDAWSAWDVADHIESLARKGWTIAAWLGEEGTRWREWQRRYLPEELQILLGRESFDVQNRDKTWKEFAEELDEEQRRQRF